MAAFGLVIVAVVAGLAIAGVHPGESAGRLEGVTDRSGPPSSAPDRSGTASFATAPAAGHSAANAPAPTTARRPVASPASSLGTASLPVVPIVGFWSAERSVTRERLAAIVAGTDRTFRRVVVATSDAAPIAAALDTRAGPVVAVNSPANVLDAVRGTTDVLGIVRAADVEPSVRALAVDGRTPVRQRPRQIARGVAP